MEHPLEHQDIQRVVCNNFATVLHSQTSLRGPSNTVYDDISAFTDPGVSSGGMLNPSIFSCCLSGVIIIYFYPW